MNYVILVTITGLLTALLIIAQCFLIARSAAPVINGTASLADVLPLIGALGLVFLTRIILTRIEQGLGHRAALDTIATLRQSLIDHVATLNPRWRATKTNQVVTLTSRGLDDLEPYFVAYIPQLLLCVTVTPITLAVVLWLDLLSAVLLVFCIPLIPVFMILIGKMTAHVSAKKLVVMQNLGDQVLDLVSGLPTLKSLGREQGPKKRIKDLGDGYTTATMSTLKIAFLSGSVLEFLATLSTALVAVEVGFRMVYGHLDLATGLVIIMLTPEIFKPLREVGSQYHASADGVAAADKALDILHESPLSDGSKQVESTDGCRIVLDDVTVSAPGRGINAPAHLSATIEPGQVTALAGSNGSGKTTTVRAILGLLRPDSGLITVNGIPVPDLESAQWWNHISWVPQRPTLVPGTISDNVGHGPGRDRAAELTGFADVVESQPHGWDTRIGQGGVGLSVGQRQRLALTRALIDDKPLVILDEPTAHLDSRSEAQILEAVRELRRQGRTVLVIAHRRALLTLADSVIDVHAEVAHDSTV